MNALAVRRAEPEVWVIVAAGVVALAARPVGKWAIAVTVAVGLAGLIFPAPFEKTVIGRSTLVLLLGVLPFAVARLAVAGHAWMPWGAMPWAVVASLIAGIAEEAFFRRAAYGWLLRYGAVAAIVVSAGLFALVHIPAYGLAPVAINFAAGVTFGWQRWASGTWAVPAATHSLANLLQLL